MTWPRQSRAESTGTYRQILSAHWAEAVISFTFASAGVSTAKSPTILALPA
jgi:hypothetical protein